MDGQRREKLQERWAAREPEITEALAEGVRCTGRGAKRVEMWRRRLGCCSKPPRESGHDAGTVSGAELMHLGCGCAVPSSCLSSA